VEMELVRELTIDESVILTSLAGEMFFNDI
jgi:hypothetical protein